MPIEMYNPNPDLKIPMGVQFKDNKDKNIIEGG